MTIGEESLGAVLVVDPMIAYELKTLAGLREADLATCWSPDIAPSTRISIFLLNLFGSMDIRGFSLKSKLLLSLLRALSEQNCRMVMVIEIGMPVRSID